MDSNRIRETFLEFFKSKGHEIVPSAPMVVKNDPTLMFTNAGMNQFKDIFLGNQPAAVVRIADSQKCLRVSGKHNDLEEVGKDTYHHTMFEMLGNWSFGDYFKKEAIEWAWELLVDVYGMDPDRMYATVFEGSPEDGVEKDEEAYRYWSKFLPEDHILPGNKKDNFWEMGEIGPCGPCSEIHYDLRDEDQIAKTPGRELVNQSDPLVIEIWNLVFMQFNRKANGSLEPLPANHVDTGMGFERLCMVLQGKKSNYDTDVFQRVIAEISELSGKKYGETDETDIAMRVISDHLRAIAFSIADGQLPSNVKAGYVIRRILRRAVRYGYTYLGFDEPFMYKLVPVLVKQLGGPYPELPAQEELIGKVIREEESSFLRTLATGIGLLEDVMARTKKRGETVIDGTSAFTLYDTYGFPIDLTELIASESGMSVDLESFEKQLEEQKNRSRNAASTETDDWVEILSAPEGEFLGYDGLEADVRITRYRRITAKNKSYYQVVFDQTPFYGNSGGQVGDVGYIESSEGKYTVRDTRKENNLTVHIMDAVPADPSARFRAVVDADKRQATANNHTATHLLQYALKKVLGDHVEQKGSMVNSDNLRFDFSHFQKVTDEEIREVEGIVNRLVRRDDRCEENRSCALEEAQRQGAMMLFGEKYGDTVRMIRFGESVELCGGTHVESTGQIGFFKIISESAISAGVRRIEAVTAEKAEEVVYRYENILNEIKGVFNTPAVVQSIKKMLEENTELENKLREAGRQRADMVRQEIENKFEEESGAKIVARQVDLSPDLLKDISFELKNSIPNLVLVLGGVIDGKPSLTVALGDEIVRKGVNAGAVVREAAKEIKGGGGGQPFYATAGGKDPAHIEAAILAAKNLVLQQI